MINTIETLAKRGKATSFSGQRSAPVLFSLPDGRLQGRLVRMLDDSEPAGAAGSLERRIKIGGQLQPDTNKKEKGIQGTVENIKLHQKGNQMVVTMEEQEEPEGCASCGQKGVKTFQYQMCRSCLAKKLRGIQDFIDEQRKEIFGDR